MRILFLFITSLNFLQASSQRKYALIVAVGNYMPESDISPIASLNDVKYINAVLKNNGFPVANIETLKDAKATKAAILKSLDAVAKKAANGDIVLLHFAMHGQQIRDQKGLGKDEDDGFDEALIPYDVKKAQYYNGVYTGEKHLRDDELGLKLIAIRNKLGKNGSLLVLIDACHSGTATRSAEFMVSRGEPMPFLNPENPMEKVMKISSKDNFFDALSDSASNMVVISGSGPHQQNLQTEISVGGKTEQVGSLSYGFYKAMSTLEKECTYETLFQKIKAFIQAHHPTQIPMVEGNTSQIVFSGRYKPEQEVINLKIADQVPSNDSVFKIDKGMMDGIAEGTTIKIYSDKNIFIADGIIERAEHFIAYGTANKPLQKTLAYLAKTESVTFGAFAVSLKIKQDAKNENHLQLNNQLHQLLKQYPFVSINNQAELMLELPTDSNNNNLQLFDVSDNVRWRKQLPQGDTLPTADFKEFMSVIKNVIRSKYLRTLPDGGALSKFIKAEIIPATPHASDAELTLLTGEDFSLKMVNNSSGELFYTVISIAPDNSIEILYPFKKKDPANYLIKRKDQVIRELAVSTKDPSGKTFLKIIISKDALDLRSVLEHTRRRAEMTSFQVALDDLFTDISNEAGTRNVSGIKAEEVGIITVSYTVKKI